MNELRAVTNPREPDGCTCIPQYVMRMPDMSAPVGREFDGQEQSWVHDAACPLTEDLLQALAEAGVT